MSRKKAILRRTISIHKPTVQKINGLSLEVVLNTYIAVTGKLTVIYRYSLTAFIPESTMISNLMKSFVFKVVI